VISTVEEAVTTPPRESLPLKVDKAALARKEPETYKEVVVAFVDVAFTSVRFVMVEVELFTSKAAPVIVCWAVQVFAFPTFKEATTAPVVGEIVRLVSPAETEETADELAAHTGRPFETISTWPEVPESASLESVFAEEAYKRSPVV